MAYIVLSQRITLQSDYKDEPFRRYHFPKRYRNQIRSGDSFLYYQGKSGPNTKHRYYFGAGVVGNVYPDPSEGDHFYADLFEAYSFPTKVPIYDPTGGYYESLQFEQVRKKPNPAWQNSIRKISSEAYLHILRAAKATDIGVQLAAAYDGGRDSPWLRVLERLNEKYRESVPDKRRALVERYLDRGSSVTHVLKEILGAECQICGIPGFTTRSGKQYIEAHHLIEVSKQLPQSLCSENVILVCPTCHRKLHHAPFTCEVTETTIVIIMFDYSVTIQRNTFAHLHQRQPGYFHQ